MEIGLDLTEADDVFEAIAVALDVETYLSEVKLSFPNIPLRFHWVRNPKHSFDLNSIFSTHPLIDEIIEEPGVTEMLKHSFDFGKMMKANTMIPPRRRTPCVGRQDWLEPEFRPLDRQVILSDPEAPGAATGHWHKSDEWTHVDTAVFLYDLAHSDQVVTDNCHIAAIASAFGVQSVNCLEMFGDAGILEHLPNVKRFPRRPETLQDQYDRLHDFSNREWESFQNRGRYPQFLNVGNARQFITNTALQYCRGFGIDVGSNKWPFPGAIECDLETHDKAFSQAPFDFVFSSHCLEHIPAWETELKLWHDSLRQDGVMFIYVPHPLMEAWLPEGPWVRGGWHVWSPDPLELVKHLRINLKMEILNYTTRPDSAWSFFVAARKT
jgi:hypothetical protein